VQILSTPSGGTAIVNASNQVVFTPASGFSGTATVQYQVTDSGGLQSNIATIYITVAAPTNNITTVTDKLYVTAFYDTLYPVTNAVGGHVAVAIHYKSQMQF
jgi:PKD repeat protein